MFCFTSAFQFSLTSVVSLCWVHLGGLWYWSGLTKLVFPVTYNKDEHLSLIPPQPSMSLNGN